MSATDKVDTVLSTRQQRSSSTLNATTTNLDQSTSNTLKQHRLLCISNHNGALPAATRSRTMQKTTMRNLDQSTPNTLKQRLHHIQCTQQHQFHTSTSQLSVTKSACLITAWHARSTFSLPTTSTKRKSTTVNNHEGEHVQHCTARYSSTSSLLSTKDTEGIQ